MRSRCQRPRPRARPLVGSRRRAGSGVIAKCLTRPQPSNSRKGICGSEHPGHCRAPQHPSGQPLLLFSFQGSCPRRHLRAWVKDFIGNLQTILAEPTPTADKLRPPSPIIWRRCARTPRRITSGSSWPGHELPDGLRQSVAALARTYQGLVERLFVEGIAKRELRAELNPNSPP